MSYKIAICGASNTGKSASRRTMRDGENVFILQSSLKASHLFTSQGKPVKPFDIVDTKGRNLKQIALDFGLPGTNGVIYKYNQELEPGTIKKESLKGNVEFVHYIEDIEVYMKFISVHLPWIHTVIIPDFTHYISEIISRTSFIERKAGGEAFQKFWELAGDALRYFILSMDSYRNDLLVVMEYHATYSEPLNCWEIYVPAGKMLIEKFKPETYYDIFLMTDAIIEEDKDGNVTKEDYHFITKRTSRFPLAKCMSLFPQTKIPNDLQIVLDKVRDYLGIPLKAIQEDII